jgi:hypothetical protein
MQRDRGPIHNIGFGVTSREFTTGDDTQNGPSPDSGYVSRALEGRPLVKNWCCSHSCWKICKRWWPKNTEKLLPKEQQDLLKAALYLGPITVY